MTTSTPPTLTPPQVLEAAARDAQRRLRVQLVHALLVDPGQALIGVGGGWGVGVGGDEWVNGLLVVMGVLVVWGGWGGGR